MRATRGAGTEPAPLTPGARRRARSRGAPQIQHDFAGTKRFFAVLATFVIVSCGGSAPVPASNVTLAPASTAEPAEAGVAAPARRDVQPAARAKRSASHAPPVRIDALGDRVPVDFEIEEMLAHAVQDEQQRRSATALVLSWVIDVDERPLLVDRALVWVHYQPAGGPESWELLHLYRHPLDGPRWHVSMVADAPHIGRMSYVKAPTSAELERFLEATWWTFDGEDGFVKLDAQICENAWKRAFGKPPERR